MRLYNLILLFTIPMFSTEQDQDIKQNKRFSKSLNNIYETQQLLGVLKIDIKLE